jgi:TolB protein
MKVRAAIIALVLGVSICAVTCNDRDVDTSDERPRAPMFLKYYEPYEPDIELNAPGYKLPLDMNIIVNLHDVSQAIDINSVSNLIRHNGFAIVEPGVYSDLSSHDFDTFYHILDRYIIPAFVTADMGLYLYHALLDETLRGIEDRAFQEVDAYIGDPKRQPFTVGKNGTGCVRGLDLMALLGSSEAMNILTNERDTDYKPYELQSGKLKDEVDLLSHVDWHANLYWSWLYSLRALLQELPEGYPEFMRTRAWQRRQLCAALASWTQLHDDTIRQPDPTTEPRPIAIAVRGPLSPPPPPPLGYVEPIPVFWGRLLSLTRMTSKGLDDLKVLTPEALRPWSRLEKLLQGILNIASRQLTNEPPSSEDREFFENLPSILGKMLPGMQEHGLATILAAEATGTEQAVGDIDLIIVACPTYDGKARLAVGPVLSYYEFKHTMSVRLTEETWRLMLDSPAKPERPGWYGPLMRPRDDFFGLTRLTNNLSRDENPCWSPDGKRIVFVGTSKEDEWLVDIYVMNADGSEQRNLTNNTAIDGSPCWSPDGQKIAFYSGVPVGPNQGNSDIYVMNADGSEQKNLTNNPAFYGGSCWSPDGQKIAFSSDRDGSFEVYVMNADGAEQKRLTNNRADDGHPCWSPDGKKIVFWSQRAGLQGEIYVMNADGSEQKRLTNISAYDGQPCWSPDGKQIAFVSYRDGNFEIYVMNADGSEQRRLTNNDAKDRSPCWSPDGRQIAFESYITAGFPEICIMNLDRADQ